MHAESSAKCKKTRNVIQALSAVKQDYSKFLHIQPRDIRILVMVYAACVPWSQQGPVPQQLLQFGMAGGR